VAVTTRSIATPDLNRDGVPDLVSANQNAGNTFGVSAQLGNGSGGFGLRTDVPVTAMPLQLLAGDFNADSNPDFVCLLGNSTLSVRLGDGQGGFTAAPDVPLGTGARQAVLQDINLDGRLDVLTVSQSTNAVSLRLGNGQGGFVPPAAPLLAEIPVGSQPFLLDVADINLDGNPDIVTATTAPALSVRFGNGRGGFNGTGTTALALRPAALVLRDVNEDMTPDLLMTYSAANRARGRVLVRLGNGLGQFAGTTDVAVDALPGSVIVSDVNRDGHVDLVTSNRSDYGYDNRTVSVRLGDGTGRFAGFTDFILGTGGNAADALTAPISLADANADGNLDLFSVSRGHTATGGGISTMGVSVRFGDGRGSFTGNIEVEASPGPIGGQGDVYGVAAGDVNRDGNMDFVTANAQSSTVSIRLGNGRNGFTALPDISLPAGSAYKVALGDVNNDDNLDFVTANYGANSFSVYWGTGTGAFAPAATIPLPTEGPYGVFLSDVNNDGNLDLLAPTYWTYRVVVRLGNGQGGFTGTQEIPLSARDLQMAVVDFNNDGFVDVVAADPQNYYRRFGDGTGNFTGTNVTTIPGPVTSLAAGDVNADGNVDFVLTQFGGGFPGRYTTFLNNAAPGNFTASTPNTLTDGSTMGKLADMTGDGVLDLVVGNTNYSSSNNITVYAGNNSGSFAFRGFTPTGTVIYDIAMGDLDNDGDIDLLAANELDATVSVRFNGGNNALPLTAELPSFPVEKRQLAVAPNPARGQAQLLNAAASSARLLDPLGRLVRTYSMTSQPLDLTGLVSGVYFVWCGARMTRLVVE
jgi:hypothetical protein